MAIAELPPLVALALLTMLILILVAYKATVGAVVDWLIRTIPDIRTPSVFGHSVSVFGWITGPLGAFQNLVYHTLGRLIAADHAVWNKFVSWNAYAWSEVSGAIADVGHGAEHALTKLRYATLPALIAAVTGPLGLLIYGLRSQLAALVKTVAHDGHRAAVTITHVVNPTVTKVTHLTKVIYRDVPVAVAAVGAVAIPRLGQLEREAGAAERWVKANAKKLTVGGIVGLMVAALGRLGLGWTRCSNVNRVGKAVCGMDKSLLDDLLLGTLLIGSSISIVELARECQAFTGEVDAGLRLFVRELG